MTRYNTRPQKPTQEQMDTVYQKNQGLMERDPELDAFKTLISEVEKKLAAFATRLERIAQ